MGAKGAGQSVARKGQRVCLAFSLLFALSAFVPSVVWIVTQPWHTAVWEDDDAIIELLIRDAARGKHFVGPYSRFRWNHPGPLLFYLAWPVYSLSGEKPAAARLAPLVINIFCAAGIVLIVRRYFGAVAGLVASMGVAIIAAHLGASIVASLWNPFATIIPFGLFLCLALGMSLSGRIFIPLSVGMASFVVQTHIGYLPTVVAVLGVASAPGGLGFLAERAGRHADARADGARFPARWILAGVSTGLVAWLSPILDQCLVKPTNLSLLWNFFTTQHGSHSLAEVVWRAAPNVSAVFLRVAPMVAARYEEPTPSVGAEILLGLLIPGLICVGWLGRSRNLRMFGILLLTALVVALASATRIVDDLHPYLFGWMCTIGLLGWTAVAILLLESFPRRRSKSAGWLLFSAAAILSMFALRWNLVFISTMPPMEPLPYVTVLSNAIKEAAGGQPPLITVRGEAWVWGAGVLNELDRTRTSFRVPDHWTFMFGRSRSSQGNERVHIVLADATTDVEVKRRSDLSLIASSGGKLVFLEGTFGQPRSSPDRTP